MERDKIPRPVNSNPIQNKLLKVEKRGDLIVGGIRILSFEHKKSKPVLMQFNPSETSIHESEYIKSESKVKVAESKFVPVMIDCQQYNRSMLFFSAIHEKFTLKDIKTACTGVNVKISSMLVVSDRVLLSGIFDQAQKTVCYNWRTKTKTDWLQGVNAFDLKRCGNYILCADVTSSRILVVKGNSVIGQTGYPFSKYAGAHVKGKAVDLNNNGLSSNVIATFRNDFAYFAQYQDDSKSGPLQEVKKLVFARVSARTGELTEFTVTVPESPYGICVLAGQVFMACLTKPLMKAVLNEGKQALQIVKTQNLEWDEELSFRTVTTADNCVIFGGNCTKGMGTFCFGMTDSELKFLHVHKIKDNSLFFWPHKLKMFNSRKGKVLFAYCLRQVIITIKIVGNKFGTHGVHKINDTLFIYGVYCHKQDHLGEQLIYGFDTLVHVNGNSLLL